MRDCKGTYFFIPYGENGNAFMVYSSVISEFFSNIKLKHHKCVKYDKSWFITASIYGILWICLYSGSFKIVVPFNESSEKLINRNASVRINVGK
jgi:hypothetical protein